MFISHKRDTFDDGCNDKLHIYNNQRITKYKNYFTSSSTSPPEPGGAGGRDDGGTSPPMLGGGGGGGMLCCWRGGAPLPYISDSLF